MAMTMSCPSCARRLNVSDAQIGKRLRCPACQQRFVVPNPQPLPVSAERTAASGANPWAGVDADATSASGIPAQPATRSRRTIWLLVGTPAIALVAAIVGVGLILSGKEPPTAPRAGVTNASSKGESVAIAQADPMSRGASKTSPGQPATAKADPSRPTPPGEHQPPEPQTREEGKLPLPEPKKPDSQPKPPAAAGDLRVIDRFDADLFVLHKQNKAGHLFTAMPFKRLRLERDARYRLIFKPLSHFIKAYGLMAKPAGIDAGGLWGAFVLSAEFGKRPLAASELMFHGGDGISGTVAPSDKEGKVTTYASSFHIDFTVSPTCKAGDRILSVSYPILHQNAGMILEVKILAEVVNLEEQAAKVDREKTPPKAPPAKPPTKAPPTKAPPDTPLTIQRSGATTLGLSSKDTLSPLMAFAFFEKRPEPKHVAAALELMKATVGELRTKAKIGGKGQEMTGFQILEFVAGLTDKTTSFGLDPFFGKANETGTYGMTGGTFQVAQQKVVFFVVHCKELRQTKAKAHSIDFLDLVNDTGLAAVRRATAVVVLTCKANNGKVTFGPSGTFFEVQPPAKPKQK